jgi:Predicted AAA-ATPase
LSFLHRFFQLGAKPEDFKLFNISLDKDFVTRHCGKYPVILLELKDCVGTTWPEMFKQVWKAINKMYLSHLHAIEESGKSQFLEYFLRSTPPESDSRSGNASAFVAVEELAYVLTKYYGSQLGTIVLVDDCDVPLKAAAKHGFFKTASTFLSCLYLACKESRGCIFKVCLMGTSRIDENEVFPDNMVFFDMNHQRFSTSFGFLEEEIHRLVSDHKEVAKVLDYYGGYCAGRTGKDKLVNPWSFIKYFKTNGEITTYWVDSLKEENALDRIPEEFLFDADLIVKLATIMNKQRVELGTMLMRQWKNPKTPDEILFYLVAMGYLTKCGVKESNEPVNQVVTTIANQEISMFWRKELPNLVRRFLKSHSKSIILEIQKAIDSSEAARIEKVLVKLLRYCRYARFDSLQDYQNYLYAMFLGSLEKGQVIAEAKEEFNVVKIVLGADVTVFNLKFVWRGTDKQLEIYAKEALTQSKDIFGDSQTNYHLFGVSFGISKSFKLVS